MHSSTLTNTQYCKLHKLSRETRRETRLHIRLISSLDHIMTSERRSDAPKIVQIETRDVETDAINFREVVQSLTGKNSSMANWPPSFTASGSDNKEGIAHHDGVSGKSEKISITDGNKNSLISPMILDNVSFKDFDLLLFDLPPMEELLRLHFPFLLHYCAFSPF